MRGRWALKWYQALCVRSNSFRAHNKGWRIVASIGVFRIRGTPLPIYATVRERTWSCTRLTLCFMGVRMVSVGTIKETNTDMDLLSKHLEQAMIQYKVPCLLYLWECDLE